MRISAWTMLLVAIGLFLSVGCGGPSARPISPEERKKADEEMRKVIPEEKKD
jgi:hypothetical protein